MFSQVIRLVLLYVRASYLQKIRYRVEAGAPCQKESLDATFRPIDVPNFAAFIGTDVLGYNSPSYGLRVDHFYLTDTEGASCTIICDILSV